jgi:hypothetical protein
MARFRIALAAIAAALIAVALNVGSAAQLDVRPGAGHAAPQARVHDFGDLSAGLLVKFKPNLSPEQMQGHLAKHGLARTKRFKAPHKAPDAAIGRWWHVHPEGRGGKQALRKLLKSGLIERIEPNFKVSIARLPNDPQFGALWGLHNIGQTGGAAGADIDAPEAWDAFTGSHQIIVAVIDTGIDHTHPDLAANMWVNPGEIPGNGIDDDGNGLVDDVHGYNFWSRTGDSRDDHGHGTHVAGTIGAVGDNGLGVVGVNWNVRLMSVKFLNASGIGFTTDAIEAVVYATDMGARVMNNSWGGGGYSQALADAISAANEAGVLFVAAAGNNGSNNDVSPFYPAGYALPNVVSVAATTAGDGLATFSNYGTASVHLGAPGVGTLSTVPVAGNACCSDPSGYKELSGTSMAAPHVSGAAALLLAQNPARSPAVLRGLLATTADPVAGLVDRVATGSRLNVMKALNCVPSRLVLLATAPGEGFKAYPQTTTRIAVQLMACDTVTGASVTVSFSTGDAPLILHDDGAHGDGAANDGIYANEWSPVGEGPVTLTISATAAGFEPATRSVSGGVRNLTSYRYEPVPYSWIDATGGTPYTFGQLTVVTIPIGFNFNFSGFDRDALTISINGYVTFDPQPWNALFWLMRPMPDPFPPNDAIAAFGEVFQSGPDTRVYTLLEGIAPSRRLTIAWVKVQHVFALQEGTFEMTLYEGSNDFVFQYQDTTFGDWSADHGRDAAIGTEDMEAVEGTQYPLLVPELTALRFYQTPYNHKPVANPGGPYSGIVKQPVTFDGSRSSDRNGDTLTYLWSFGDPFANAIPGTGVSPTYTYRNKGRYTATLTVSDGLKQSDPMSVIVDIPNHPPVASAGGPYSGLGNETVTFNPSASDIDNDSLIYKWTVRNSAGQLSGTIVGNGGFFLPGDYTVTLVVSDGVVDSAPSSTTMAIANQPPRVNAGADTFMRRGSWSSLSASGSDTDGQIVTWAWRQLNGEPLQLTGLNQARLEIFVPKNYKTGNVLFEITVTDNLGARASDQVVLEVIR